ncbi:MAG: hypothetical protein QXH91_08435, partial [Candidatus Bathyarchaeia archaeon]
MMKGKKVKRSNLTSGNLASGDPTHSETAVFLETPHNSPLTQIFKVFFGEIESRAKPFRDYEKLVRGVPQGLRQILDFSFVGSINLVNFRQVQVSQVFFTAPFIMVESKGSNHYA